MPARNMKELETMLRKQLKKALQVTAKKSLEDMYSATGDFYTQQSALQNQGKGYKRTGALGDTPRTTAITDSGLDMSFKAYLDTQYEYTSGSNPNMQQVLELANDGTPFKTKNGYDARLTNGKKHFWEKAEKDIEKDFDETLGQFFK
jgi:hypothetical protein